MCEPASIATTLAITSAVAETAGAVGRHAAAAKQNAQGTINAADALGQVYQQLNTRAAQEQDSTSSTVRRIQRQIQASQGETLALSGAYGVTGPSVTAALNELTAAGAQDITDVTANRDNVLDQIDQQKLGAQADAKNRANSVQAPSALIPAIQIGGTALGLADRFTKRSPP